MMIGTEKTVLLIMPDTITRTLPGGVLSHGESKILSLRWSCFESACRDLMHVAETQARRPLRSRSSPYLLHSEIEPPSQKKSQRSTVHVPDFCGNLFDTRIAGLQ
jgi:hypothetical protein